MVICQPTTSSGVVGLIPGLKVVRRTVIWVHLPGHLMEFEEPDLLLCIALMVIKPVALDNFTSK